MSQGDQPPPSGPAVKGDGVAAGRPVGIVVTRPDTAVLEPGTTLPTDDVTGASGSPDGDGDADGDGDVDPVPGPEPSGRDPAGRTARGARLSWWRRARRSGSGEVGQGHRWTPQGAGELQGPGARRGVRWDARSPPESRRRPAATRRRGRAGRMDDRGRSLGTADQAQRDQQRRGGAAQSGDGVTTSVRGRRMSALLRLR